MTPLNKSRLRVAQRRWKREDQARAETFRRSHNGKRHDRANLVDIVATLVVVVAALSLLYV